MIQQVFMPVCDVCNKYQEKSGHPVVYPSRENCEARIKSAGWVIEPAIEGVDVHICSKCKKKMEVK